MTEILHRTIDLPTDDKDDAELAVYDVEDDCLQIVMDNRGYRKIEVKIVIRSVDSSGETELLRRRIALPNDNIDNAKDAVDGLQEECVQFSMNCRHYDQLETEVLVESVNPDDCDDGGVESRHLS